MRAERGRDRFVLRVLGLGLRRVAEDAADRGVAPGGADFYSATKVAAERLAQAYDQHLDIAILRLFVPYGPGQERRMLPRLVERVRAGAPIQLNRDGRPRMNPIYVDDVVDVVLRRSTRREHRRAQRRR